MSASSKKKLRKEQNAASLTEKQRQEQKEAKKLKAITVTFVVAMVLVVVIALGAVLSTFVSRSGWTEKHTIAATVGEHEISSVEMSYFYVDAISSTYNQWYQYYGSYTSTYVKMLMGLDLTQPLGSQTYGSEEGTTWADVFIESAMSSAKSTYALYDKAMAEGYKLTEEENASLESSIKMISTYASYYRYDSADAYLQATYGNGASLESFRDYCYVTTLADSYYNAYVDSLSYDDAAIRDYEADKFNHYSSYTYASYYLGVSSFLTGGTTDEETNTVTYSEEERAAAREAAEAAAKSLTTDTITDLTLLDRAIGLLDINKDAESPVTSTKNERVIYSSINSAIVDWVTDDSRQPGDLTMIPSTTTSTDEDGNETTTVNGYYVVFFQEVSDNAFPMSNVRHLLVAFEGGTTDGDGNKVYTDEEKQAALDKATSLWSKWLSNDPSEDSFIELVKENTDDTASASTGGLYENITPDSSYVENFLNWAVADHNPGDSGIVETEYGYHIMYYAGDSELTYRDYMITNDMTNHDVSNWYTALVEAATITEGNTSKLNRDLVISPSTSY